MNQRQIAIVTGWSLVLMALIAGFVFGYAMPQFNTPDELESIQEQVIAERGLYIAMVVGAMSILVLDLIVSYTFYKFFMHDHGVISALSGALRFTYTLIFSFSSIYLFKNLDLTQATNEAVLLNFQTFQSIWSAGLVVFGIHILLLGYLAQLHQGVPVFLWVMIIIAGLSYTLVQALKFSHVDAELVDQLEISLALPMTVGELGLAIWLLVRGGKTVQNKK